MDANNHCGGLSLEGPPQDAESNREMVASLTHDEMKRNDGVFLQRDAYIERMEG